MDDLISRQAAIDAVRTYYDDEYALADSIEELIEKLPSAQPERMRGRWGTTVASPILIVCNRCGRTVLKNGSVHWNFCPNCGARMEVNR